MISRNAGSFLSPPPAGYAPGHEPNPVLAAMLAAISLIAGFTSAVCFAAMQTPDLVDRTFMLLCAAVFALLSAACGGTATSELDLIWRRLRSQKKKMDRRQLTGTRQ